MGDVDEGLSDTLDDFETNLDSEESDDACAEEPAGLRALGIPGLWLPNARSLRLLGMFLIHVAVLTFPVVRGADLCDNIRPTAEMQHAMVAGKRMYSLCPTAVLGLFAVFEYLRADTSTPTRSAGHVMIIAWATLMVAAASNSATRCMPQENAEIVGDALDVVKNGMIMLMGYVFQGAVQKRVELTEASFGAPLGSSKIYAMRRASLVIGFISFSCLAPTSTSALVVHEKHLLSRKMRTYFIFSYSVCQAISAVTFVLTALVVAQAFRVVSAATLTGPGKCNGYMNAEAAWARQILMRLRFATTVPCGFAAFANALYAVRWIFLTLKHPWSNTVYIVSAPVAEMITALLDVACLFAFVGFFHPQKPQIKMFEAEFEEVERPLSQLGTLWVAKARQLADRSIDVEALLEFYGEKLPLAMPHYDPKRSTTNDVVRHAVIPLSRTEDGGRAYADVVHPGARDPPTCMVTHTWSNLFADLVAAVVADALDEEEYQDVLRKLNCKQGRARLTAELQAKSALHQRYWICSFCVNQHAGICGGFGPAPPEGTELHSRWDRNRRDSVTGETLPSCGCGQPKFFNDEPDLCEINKFDDIMGILHRSVRDFRQVVAVDRRFDVFTRAWCVAELVEAHFSGITQSVRILSDQVLDIYAEDLTIYTKLATLKISECEAARPEDKDQILSKIKDKNSFDAKLQSVIFGQKRGILRRQFVGFGVLEAAARVARRVATVRVQTSRAASPRSVSASTGLAFADPIACFV